MTHDHTPVDAERIEHPGEVSDEVALSVGFDRLRAVGIAIAALVGCDRAKARIGECAHLMAPRIPELWKAMAEDDRIARAGLGNVHSDAVGIDEFVSELSHAQSPRLGS